MATGVHDATVAALHRDIERQNKENAALIASILQDYRSTMEPILRSILEEIRAANHRHP